MTYGEYLGAGGSTAVIDDFNSYTNGNLNGQGGWSGDTSYQVQSSAVYEGAKAISCASGTNDVVITKSIGAYTSGIVGFAFRINFTGIFAASSYLRYNGTNICGIDYYYQSGPGAINFQVTGVGTTTLQSSLTIGTWYFGEIELDQTNSRVRARLNGGTWTVWVTKSFTSINQITLGKASNGDTANSYYDYITYTPSPTTKLLLHLNGNSTDSSGNGNNGTDNAITYVDGKFGKCASGNGSTSYIETPSASIISATNFTITTWCKITSVPAGTGQIICSDNVSGNVRLFQLGCLNSGLVRFLRFDSGNSLVTNFNSSVAINDGKFHCIKAVFDNAVGSKLYIDGLLVGSDSVTTNNNSSSQPVTLLANTSPSGRTEFLNALVDESFIENVSDSQSTVSKYYSYASGRYATL